MARERRSDPKQPKRTSRTHSDAIAFPGAGAWLWCAAFAIVMLVSPPQSNWVWAVNGFRSLPGPWSFVLLITAAASALLVLLTTRARWRWNAFAIAVIILAAFLLRERLHFLGDSDLRVRAISAMSEGAVSHGIGEWSQRLHANPADVVVNLLIPAMLHRAGASLHLALSLDSVLLGLLYFAAVGRLVTTLRVPEESKLAFGAALVLGGTIGCFAGYSESAGVLFVAATWWWAEMLPPLADRRQAARLALAWLAMFLAHRLGVLMLAPLAWRALGPAHAGDTPGARRSLLLFTLAGGVLALALLVAIVGPSLIVADLRETFQAAAGETRGPDAPFVGFFNAIWLVAPLAFLVPAIAGRRTLAEFVRDRATQPLLIACAIALPFTWIQTTRAVGQGPHRDWDVTVLLGFPLALAGATLLARLPAPRLRGALMILLPVVTLLGGSWLAVNADEPEAMLRVIALATQPPHGTDSQICGIELYLGQHAMNAGQPALAARHYDRAFELIANPRHALLASESHVVAGERAAAVTMLEKARARGLNPELQVVADRITRMIAERDSEQAQRSTRTP